MTKKPQSGSRKKKGAQPAEAPDPESLRIPPPVRGEKVDLVNGSFKAPTKDQVVRLVKRLENLAKTASEASGEVGSAVQKAAENQHFDKTALSIVRRLYKMSPNKLQVTLPQLLKMIDDLELEERATEQARMFREQGEKEEGGEGDGEGGDEGAGESTASEAAQDQGHGRRGGASISIVPKIAASAQ